MPWVAGRVGIARRVHVVTRVQRWEHARVAGVISLRTPSPIALGSPRRSCERLAYLVKDFGQDEAAAARCLGLLDELESLGVSTRSSASGDGNTLAQPA